MTLDSTRFQITTQSLEETHLLGQKIGSNLKTKMVFSLTGDLGSGKTSFVQGLAKGLMVPEEYYITSPTFTLVNEYPGKIGLVHIDLYRIQDIIELEDLGFDEILNSNRVIAIEWAEKLPDNYLQKQLIMLFRIINDTSRDISLIPSGLEAENLINGIGL